MKFSLPATNQDLELYHEVTATWEKWYSFLFCTKFPYRPHDVPLCSVSIWKRCQREAVQQGSVTRSDKFASDSKIWNVLLNWLVDSEWLISVLFFTFPARCNCSMLTSTHYTVTSVRSLLLSLASD